MPHPLSHGIDTYFGEFFANRRRVATVLLVVSGMLALVVAVAGRRASEVFEDPKRFGYEGPKQWVDRIRLEQMAEAWEQLAAEQRFKPKQPKPD